MPQPRSAAPRRRTRPLALDLVDALTERVRAGHLAPGMKLPTEAGFMAEFGVSRTVVREALSKLQAAGVVDTHHGVGTFVSAAPAPHARVLRLPLGSRQLATLRDVVAVLELRIGVETEAAALAAQRRSDANLRAMRRALDAFAQALSAGRDAVEADAAFHAEIARATHNSHFVALMVAMGAKIIPRARVGAAGLDDDRQAYLRRVNAEHESIFDAVAAQDAEAARAAMRTHLANSRERRRRAAALAPAA
jgi:GntR family transcriptional regulator, transcriptional repressor for pyruvate dehydrogenase complex